VQDILSRSEFCVERYCRRISAIGLHENNIGAAPAAILLSSRSAPSRYPRGDALPRRRGRRCIFAALLLELAQLIGRDTPDLTAQRASAMKLSLPSRRPDSPRSAGAARFASHQASPDRRALSSDAVGGSECMVKGAGGDMIPTARRNHDLLRQSRQE
jgi:hypothetical protein